MSKQNLGSLTAQRIAINLIGIEAWNRLVQELKETKPMCIEDIAALDGLGIRRTTTGEIFLMPSRMNRPAHTPWISLGSYTGLDVHYRTIPLADAVIVISQGRAILDSIKSSCLHYSSNARL